MGPRTGLDVCEKSRPTGIQSPDRPARSQSLYRLSYIVVKENIKQKTAESYTKLTKFESVHGFICPSSLRTVIWLKNCSKRTQNWNKFYRRLVYQDTADHDCFLV
jgi:hypothetical protein